MLEKNYKLHCSIRNIVSCFPPKVCPEIIIVLFQQELTDPLNMQEKVTKILEDLNADQMRAKNMDIDDFMKILYAFNSADIHFS